MMTHVARILRVLLLVFGSVVIGTIAAEGSEPKLFQVAADSSEADVDLTNQLKQADCLSQRYNMPRYYTGHTYDYTVRAAVIRLQQQNGLSPDGIPGPKTLYALENGKRCSFSQKELDEIFSLFKSAKANDRLKASATLMAIGELAKESVLNVVNRLKSNNPIESFIAANVLNVIAEEEVTAPIFINLIKSSKADDRYTGALFLSRSNSYSLYPREAIISRYLREALPTLINLVTDERVPTVQRNDTVSYQTSLLLISMGTDAYAAIPALIDQLDLKRFQSNPRHNLGKNVGILADALYSAFSTGKTTRNQPYPTTEDLLQGLTSSNQKIRRAAAFVIGYKTATEKIAIGIDEKVFDKLMEIVKNPSEDMDLRKTSAISLMVFKQDVKWFFTENNLISILDKWKECPRSRSEARLAARNGSVVKNKHGEVAYFIPSRFICGSTPGNDQGDGLGSWFDWSWWYGRGN